MATAVNSRILDVIVGHTPLATIHRQAVDRPHERVRPMTMADADLTKRALLLRVLEQQTLINERLTAMSTNLDALQATVTQLTTIVAGIPPVLAANVALSQSAIAKLEDLAAQIAALTPTQAAIDALNASVTQAVSDLQTDTAEVASTNAAIQAELDKLNPPPPPTTGPTT